MKKIFVILFCVVLLMTVAFAEVDLDSMTSEELTELYSAIGSKLWGEKIASEDGAKLIYGKYIVGVDIPEGTYVIATKDDVSNEYDRTYITVYENDDEKAKRISLDSIGNGFSEVQLAGLKEGNVIYITTYSYKLDLRLYTFSAYMNNLE